LPRDSGCLDLVPLRHWGRGFEFCSGHGYHLRLCVCCGSICRRSIRGFLRCNELTTTPRLTSKTITDPKWILNWSYQKAESLTAEQVGHYICIYVFRVAQVLQISRSHLKILGARSVTWSKLKTIGATVHNLVLRPTLATEFVHPCCVIYVHHIHVT
jgi:hypothetical protein